MQDTRDENTIYALVVEISAIALSQGWGGVIAINR